ncbi:MAG: (2Fe-2S)-binding protein, partial [Nitrospinae bacterium]|nr:(2Fe-2S)-binding protein [Nitrospinota bacterium]
MSSNGANGAICQCLQVSEQTIRSCIESGNLKTIEQVTLACSAGGGCQSCHILLQLFIDEYQGETVSMEDLIHDFAPKVKKRG